MWYMGHQFSLLDSRTDDSINLPGGIQSSQPLSGGLWSPETLPLISLEEINLTADMSYQQVAEVVLGRFDFGIPQNDLYKVIKQAYGDQWYNKDITPVKEIGDTNMYSLHLWYGPTFAFKNVALEFLPRVLSEIVPDKILHVLWASSWDTVNAAHSWVKGTNINSIFMLPNSGPSYVQELQAKNGISDNPNALTLVADMPFDPLQDIVKKINGPVFKDFKDKNNITSFNSINIARILAQVVYYFRAYGQLIKNEKIKLGDKVIYSVPSGNFGDALAGYYAKKMWVPIEKIHIATNENDMLRRFIEEWVYEPPKKDGNDFVEVTNSPSMDIAKSSNFERMLFDITENDYQRVAWWYADLEKIWKFQVDDETLANIQEIFTASSSTDEERLGAIKEMSEAHNHGIDPHTAAGVFPFLWKENDTPVIFLETSHVAQFGKELKAKWLLVPGMDEFDQVIHAMEKNKPVEWRDYINISWDFDETYKQVQYAIDNIFSAK